MVLLRIAFRLASAGRPAPKEVVAAANRLIAPDLRRGMFVALVFGCLDPATGRATIVDCAHNPPLRCDPLLAVRTSPPGGLPLGMAASERFEANLAQEEIVVPPGGHLLFATDGVVEALDGKNRRFGEGRVLEALKRDAAKEPAAVVDGLKALLDAHRAGAPPSDDVAILDLRRDPPR
jgi:serine phosphatase RsbU (regulator of sigma subunit)